MEILGWKDIEKAAAIVRNGGLIAFPTETVQGLGVIFDDFAAFRRMNAAKGRRPGQPYTLMCADPEDIGKFAVIDERAKRIIERFVPGEITIVLKAKVDEPAWMISEDGFIGFRVSNSKHVRDLIRKVGKPMFVTSANLSGQPALIKSDNVKELFKDKVDAMIEGDAGGSRPSTVVKVAKDVTVIRVGGISRKQIEETISGGD